MSGSQICFNHFSSKLVKGKLVSSMLPRVPNVQRSAVVHEKCCWFYNQELEEITPGRLP